MPKKKSRLNLYIMIATVIAAVIAGYYLPTKDSGDGMKLSPKQAIELEQRKQAQRELFSE